MANTTNTEPRAVTTWRWIAAVLALGQLAAPFVADALAGNFLESGATNEALITPAGYAFGLWGLITALSAATAVAVLRYGLGAWWEMSLLIDASVVFIGFSVWLAVAARNWLWLSVVVFAVMVSALIHIMRLLTRRSHDMAHPRWLAMLATVSFGLYLGWSSIAVFANVAAALINSGLSASAAGWQFVVLVAAAVFAVGMTAMLRGSVGYVAAALWALVAIAIAAADRGSMPLATTAGVAAAIVVVVAIAVRRRATP